MTDSQILRDKIEQSGYKLGFIALSLNLTRQGLRKKLDNESEFKASEIQSLKNLLKLTNKERDEIFFK